ncbi:helix-turn-helix domain-containing protein [Paenibacillus yanchengensis]|uniref:Helix-turn-helix domain-containing protein n=1 Tax=Paenibacillus yanchengensis TaxID=2035833 RepID=A0ABW4YGA1_9BACL
MQIDKTKQSTFFHKYLWSYLFFLFVSLTISIYAYQQSIYTMKQEAEQLNETILTQSEAALHDVLSEIKETVALLSLDTDVLQLMITADYPWQPEVIYQFSELQKNKLSMLSTSPTFSQLFIHFNHSDAVLSKDAVWSLTDLPLRINDESYADWIKQAIATKRVNQFIRLESVSNRSHTEPYLAYISTLPMSNQQLIDGAIVIFIEEKSITQLFQQLLAEESAFAMIWDEQQQLLVAENRAHHELPSELQLATVGEIRTKVQDELLLTSYHSPYNGWQYQIGIPTKHVFAKADNLKRLNMMILAIGLIVGTLAALWLAYRSSRPVAELYDSVRSLTRTVQHHTMLQIRANEQKSALQQACLERAIRGRFADAGELSHHFEQAGLALAGNWYAVAIVKLLPNVYIEKAALNEEQLLRVIQEQLEELFVSVGYICRLGQAELAVVYVITEQVANATLWPEQLQSMQMDWWHEYYCRTAIATGLFYNQPLQIWRSYNEALQVLDSEKVLEHVTIHHYEQLQLPTDHYYYPLELEMLVTKSVQTGDLEQLEQWLTQLDIQNYQLRQLSQKNERLLLDELLATVYKLGDQFKPVWDEVWPERNDRNELSTISISFAQVTLLLKNCCMQVHEKRLRKQHQLFTSIKDYIDQHYSDYNLSLSLVAEQCKQSESFVSVFFKEHMGITFSEYVEQLRLEAAKVLLTDMDQSIAMIAETVGYGNDKTFRRAFKRVYGIQPTSYRKNQ